MDEGARLVKRFTQAAAALAEHLGDQLKAASPKDHANLQEAMAAGMPVAVSMVTAIGSGASVRLEVEDLDGQRHPLLTLHAVEPRRH
jgi:hypothetical protein